jgi:hypothetical protein
MLIYLDLNVYYRDYDDQTQIRIRRESKAIDFIFEFVDNGKHKLCGSFMLDEENNANPLIGLKTEIKVILSKCELYVKPHQAIREIAGEITNNSRTKSKDALHLACAVYRRCDYFITCDDKFIKTVK